MNRVLLSSKSNEWTTPQSFFDSLNKEFSFTLDPCATKENGLVQSWKGERVFCNPPYGKEIASWIEKCDHEIRNGCELIVLLIPARTDTKYFHDYIYQKHDIRFIKGRLHFNDSKQSAPFPFNGGSDA